MLPPLRLMVCVPASAVIVPVHVPPKPLGVLIANPPGRTSVKLTPVRAAEAFGLVRVKVNVLAEPTEMGLVPNDLEMVGTVGS